MPAQKTLLNEKHYFIIGRATFIDTEAWWQVLHPLSQCSVNFFASRHPWLLKWTFATPSAIEIDKSGAFNEYSRNLATPSLRNTALSISMYFQIARSNHPSIISFGFSCMFDIFKLCLKSKCFWKYICKVFF